MVLTIAGPTLSETAENMGQFAVDSAGSSVEDAAAVVSGDVGQTESAAPAPVVVVAEGPVVGIAGFKERTPSVEAGTATGRGKVLRQKGGASPDSDVIMIPDFYDKSLVHITGFSNA